MRNLLSRAYRSIQLRLSNSSWDKAYISLKHQHPANVEKTNGGAKLRLLNIVVPFQRFTFILEEYDRLIRFKDQSNASLIINQEGFFIKMGDIKINITSAEEIFVAEEIFLKKIYSFQGQSDFNVIDVGMNVGFGTLFFAGNARISRVFSFEPFEKTFRQAEINFKLNPELARKVTPFQFALGDKSEVIWVEYDYENKAQIGIHGTSYVKSQLKAKSKQEMIIKEASMEVLRIIKDYPGNYLLKLDCEGAEYMILRALDKNNLLGYFQAIIIEWHEDGPKELIEILIRNNFSIFEQNDVSKSIGMLYALKNT